MAGYDSEIDDETAEETSGEVSVEVDEDEAESDELRKVHYDALVEFDRVQKALRDERLMSLQDRRFYSIAGAMWEGPLGAQFENKPRFEMNKIHLAVIRIINEYRSNRIDVSFIPKDGGEAGTLSDTCAGLYRADEQDSNAEEAMDNAFEEAAGGGYGAWRLRCDYEDEGDEDNDKQKIFIEPIFDADSSVFFDLDAKRQDKNDARRCWVISSMSRTAYIDEYGDDPASWPKNIYQLQFDWLTPDVVYIAQYYVIEKVAKTMVTYKGLSGEIRKFDIAELNRQDRSDLKDQGFKQIDRRNIKVKKVHKYLLNGVRVMEDWGYIAGPNIPIVPVYGKRWFIDNVERCMGHVRLAKDAQRLKNMQMSKLGEQAALSSTEKPIFTPEQMAGHAVMWSEDNIKNYPYLLLNPIKDAQGNPIQNGPIGYTKPPAISPAMGALLQITDVDIKEILGNQEAGEEIQANTSGVATELVQQRLDMQTFIYISNMAKAVKRSGEIWLGMAREVYTKEGRKKKTINKSGEASQVTLNSPGVDANTGVSGIQNDLTKADFDVQAIPGPTSASKRASIVRVLMGLLAISQDPQTVAVITAMIITNLEGEGIQDIRDFFHMKLVQMGAIKPTPEEQQQLQAQAKQAAQQPPSANDQFLLSQAKESEAAALKDQASTIKIAADAELAKAQAMKIISDIKAGNLETAFRGIESLSNAALTQAQTQHTGAQMQNTQAQTAALQQPQPASGDDSLSAGS